MKVAFGILALYISMPLSIAATQIATANQATPAPLQHSAKLVAPKLGGVR